MKPNESSLIVRTVLINFYNAQTHFTWAEGRTGKTNGKNNGYPDSALRYTPTSLQAYKSCNGKKWNSDVHYDYSQPSVDLPYNNNNSAHVEREIKSDTSNNRGNWNHLKIIQTVPQKHTEKARIKELQKNSDSGHCTHTSQSTNVKVQNIFNMRNNITCSAHCKYRTGAKLYTLQRWFFSGI